MDELTYANKSIRKAILLWTFNDFQNNEFLWNVFWKN